MTRKEAIVDVLKCNIYIHSFTKQFGTPSIVYQSGHIKHKIAFTAIALYMTDNSLPKTYINSLTRYLDGDGDITVLGPFLEYNKNTIDEILNLWNKAEKVYAKRFGKAKRYMDIIQRKFILHVNYLYGKERNYHK